MSVHWADVVAEKLAEKKDKHVLATAITPSGPIHVGNLREVMTTEAIYRALKDRGIKAELIYIGDTFDPLRKLYPFLPSHYEKYVGMPLAEIPCPCNEHKNYAEHFLQPFLESLKELGIKPEVYLAHELYKEGKYNEAIKIALDKANEIREILEKIAKRDLPPNWMPFNVKCENCNRLEGEIVEYEYPYAKYKCKSCKFEGEIDLRKGGIGKLPWRIDWPARWKIFGVTFEAFGKDHAAAGSSWDTGKEISKKIYNYEPPMPLVYEFIHLKGKGAMHGSTGVAVAANEVLKMLPAEVLRFLFMKYEPSRHIEFDTGFGLLDLVDEYDKYERIYFGLEKEIAGMKDVKRVYELSQPYKVPKSKPFNIPYRHLAVVAQIGRNFDEVVEILSRKYDLKDVDLERLKGRYEKVLYWLKNYAPEEIKFELQREKPDVELEEEEKNFLRKLKEHFEKIEWDAEKIHTAIHETAKEMSMKAGKAFSTIYKIFLKKERGPRAGYFLQSLGREFVLKRIKEFI
ncbi:MAG: lysine--tRNA ligase [Thermoplasmata archaeon]|nr:MAG: lysine--tRNA ligase [Thermoplasmata archaeon]